MHELVYYAATVWLTLLVIACATLVLRGSRTSTKILALDTLVLILVGLLGMYSISEGVEHFLDAALVLALLGFLGTLAAARFRERGELFS